jgi:uncharacterized protein (DUF433 family)
LLSNPHPYIAHHPNIYNGKAIIAGTRVKVSEIVLEYEHFGWTPSQIIDSYKILTLAQVHDALSYYYEHHAELDSEVAEEKRRVDVFSSQYANQFPPKSAPLTFVWVFDGHNARFPSAVFSTFEVANEWITDNSLSGVLTKYPVDISVFDSCIKLGLFKPKREEHFSPEFIQRFSSAHQEHYHYGNRSEIENN